MTSRPRRTLARKTISSRLLSAGRSNSAKVPEGTPGASVPLSAMTLRLPPAARKTPSEARAPAIAAPNATLPASLSAGSGCLANSESVPPPGTASPIAASLTIREAVARKMPSRALARTMLA